ncbi:MAG: metal-binding protein [Gammaproteobacteria bacterium]|nr:metal-binding protein [Gammaproteobacteria bacterium]
MLPRLPKEIDAFELADRHANIRGELEIGSFDRLSELLFDNAGTVTFDLTFSKQGRLTAVEGHLSATLVLKCQRCLDALEWPIDNDIKLGVVISSEQIRRLPEGYEPLLLAENGLISLMTLVEDELLLCLPDIPKHRYECSVPLTSENRQTAVSGVKTKKETPFSVLANLKNLENHNGSTKK